MKRKELTKTLMMILNRKKPLVSMWIEKIYFSVSRVNPLSPHDALKHHFASLKNDLIS